ncbi:oxysterol-binding protein-related protein 11-like isoform X2 [Patiria miniata]|uniref:Oxysterol-binding protein n=1 Tax=Patiria miniata TaxID=46514 RepID=A0A913ZPK3_PATMI|nr:oxysterol-binding protein-related protein 11-like isoform X2 [Patiria miniata]
MAATTDVMGIEDAIKSENLGLSEAEKIRLETVLKRAKEVEEEDFFSHPMEGTLNKYTNVVKGWQNRWFLLDPQKGTLEYYVTEESRKTQRPRGLVHLTGAVISPSDEDSMTFNVNAANGEVYRLRATDAKERQFWVSRLRAVVQRQGEVISQSLGDTTSPSSSQGSNDSLQQRSVMRRHHYNAAPRQSPSNSLGRHTRPPSLAPSLTPSVTQESLHNARDIITIAEEQQRMLVQALESLPSSGHPINSLDHDCLLLKSTSHSAMGCLEDCLNILQRQDIAQGHRSNSDLQRSMANISLDLHVANPQPVGSVINTNSPSHLPASNGVADSSDRRVPFINPADEVEDKEGGEDEDIGGVEEHKSVILHLLSQLKLGMDLTKVVLPTFILEKRSLLEMYADFMAHPDMFARIPSLPTPEARMMAVVEYYLCSFHVGRKGSIAKKPFNPIIGETFHCSWDLPSNSSQSDGPVENGRVTFVAEQVSHHPPVSAFYAECPSKKICMNSWIWTKSKFLGMSVGVNNAGEGTIRDLEHNEDYTMTFPSAYGRSILTVPWMELGGRCTIQCAQSGYQAAITFQTKPFYGGKVHRLNAEVKNPANTVICRVQGEWNGQLEFSYAGGEKKVVDLTKLSSIPKKVRPMDMQGAFESRRLWHNVSNALKIGDINTATEHKRYLEEIQRREERERKETNTPWQTKLFKKNEEGWSYNRVLQVQ